MIPKCKQKVLYESSSGSPEEIILNDDISNYKYLEIYFSNNLLNNLHSVKITSLDNKSSSLCLENMYLENDIVIYEKRLKLIKINSNSITTIRESFMEVKGTTTSSNVQPTINNQKVYIYKVVGYN